MKSGWGWSLRPVIEGRRRDAGWMAAFVAAAPWVTVAILVLMLYLASGTLAAARGVVFDLPEGGFGEGERTSLVALVLPMTRETLVFFDDARYVLDDPQSLAAFREQLSERAARLRERTLLVLADRRVAAGDLLAFADTVRSSGIERILFAEKQPVEGAE